MCNPWLDPPLIPPFELPAERESIAGLEGINPDSLPEAFIGNPGLAAVYLLNLNSEDSPEGKKAHADPAFRKALSLADTISLGPEDEHYK